jgi:hypothetical protein
MSNIKTPSVKEEQRTISRIVTPPITTTPATAIAASGDVANAQAYVTPAKSVSPVATTTAEPGLSSRKRKRGSDGMLFLVEMGIAVRIALMRKQYSRKFL